MIYENPYAACRRLSQEMRRKLTQQSTELAIERNRRMLEGIAQADRETNYLVDENGEYFQ